MSVKKNGMISPTYAFQIPMHYFIVMKIVEATGDPNQLRFSEHSIRLLICRTYQLQPIDFRVFSHIFQYISMLHPLRHHAKLKQFWRHAFNGQDVGMLHSLRNDDFLAVFLDGGSPVNI